MGQEPSADSSYVTVWTTTPTQVSGKGGCVAQTVRNAIAGAVGHPGNLKVELADGKLEDDPGITDRPAREGDGVTKADADRVPRPRVLRP